MRSKDVRIGERYVACKGDRMYNFKAIEWDAINLSDEEWREEYGTDPKVNRP